MDSYIISDRARAESAGNQAAASAVAAQFEADNASFPANANLYDDEADFLASTADGDFGIYDGTAYKNEAGAAVAKYNFNLVVSNIAELRATKGNAARSHGYVKGHSTPGDGGGGPIFWDAASVEDDNGVTIFKVAGVVTGRWKVLNENAIIGPTDPEDQRATTPVGPAIRRKLVTTENITLYVDPASGSDSNSGSTSGSPLQTINAALEKIPRWVFHKVRIYLLDGDYSAQDSLIVMNYFISPRGDAGFWIIGHVASTDGEAHPVYADTDPDAVMLNDNILLGGVRGTEEFTMAGFKVSGRIQIYDSILRLFDVNFDTGNGVIGQCVGGHAGTLIATDCDFSNAGSVFNATDHTRFYFNSCTQSNLSNHLGNVNRGAIVTIEGGNLSDETPEVTNGGIYIDSDGQPLFGGSTALKAFISNQILASATGIKRDVNNSVLNLSSSTSPNTSEILGALISLFGEEHASRPGDAIIDIGGETTDPESVFLIRYKDSSGTENILEINKFGRTELKKNDFEAAQAGKGIICKTPDGLNSYRIRVDNSGNLVTDAL